MKTIIHMFRLRGTNFHSIQKKPVYYLSHKKKKTVESKGRRIKNKNSQGW